MLQILQPLKSHSYQCHMNDGISQQNQISCFNHRVATLFADKLEVVVRRRGSETNYIRQLERKLAQLSSYKIYNHNRADLNH